MCAVLLVIIIFLMLTTTYAKFTAEPFERGYGVTVGNGLRRVLLSSFEGTAVTSVKIQGVKHEFSSIDGVKEDVTDIILALKALRIATGIVKRTAKDITYDEKECAQKREKLEKMRADGADSHDISKQEEMLVESTTSLARSQEKIVGARAELSALVEQSSGDAEATASPLYAAALEVLESSK